MLQSQLNKIARHLQNIYKDNFSEQLVNEIYRLLSPYTSFKMSKNPLWDETDIILITYGNSVISQKARPLETLRWFLNKYINTSVSCIHILPFFPYSSDDGFSVIDYMSVNSELGNWNDIKMIGSKYDLMIDLVINHVSKSHVWFKNYLENKDPGKNFFIQPDPGDDLSSVIRPRSSPLLTSFNAIDGKREVWTTFSDDQVDLNFRNPEVLVEMLKILVFYINQGARILRLDAIAFLWKQPGTSCLHLPETHEIVKLIRTVGSLINPNIIILTETNVPHHENISYFGNGDEAQLVYQFSLPPFLLYTLYTGNANYLNSWLTSLADPPEGCTFLNFTASHDGIGVRPLEGLLSKNELDMLFKGMLKFGGRLSYRKNKDGTESVYEINIAYFDALKGTSEGEDDKQIARFLCSQLIMLSLKGIPAVYIHSMLATPNDYEGMKLTGRFRSINRKKYLDTEIESLLSENTVNRYVFNELKRIIDIRKKQPAFHPDSAQQVIKTGDHFVSFRRKNQTINEEIICISNITNKEQELFYPYDNSENLYIDLLSEQKPISLNQKITLKPYQSVWLKPYQKNCLINS